MIQRCGLGLDSFQGMGMSVLRAEVASVQRFMMGHHHAMVVDPGEPGGVMLDAWKKGPVGAIATDGIEALEVAFVRRHFQRSSPCPGQTMISGLHMKMAGQRRETVSCHVSCFSYAAQGEVLHHTSAWLLRMPG